MKYHAVHLLYLVCRREREVGTDAHTGIKAILTYAKKIMDNSEKYPEVEYMSHIKHTIEFEKSKVIEKILI